jgi:hypothetical protein
VGLTIFHRIFMNISHIHTECGNIQEYILWNTITPT